MIYIVYLKNQLNFTCIVIIISSTRIIILTQMLEASIDDVTNSTHSLIPYSDVMEMLQSYIYIIT